MIRSPQSGTAKKNATAGLLLALSVAAVAAATASGCDSGPLPPEPRYYQGQLCSDGSAGDLFQSRIQPLLADDRPSSCNECHLSGIDLGMFVADSPCDSMACLVDQGMVNLAEPENSQILTWIRRAHPKSSLITQRVIDEEYNGMLDWIQFNAACGQSICAGAVCTKTRDTFCEAASEPTLDEVVNASEPTGCEDKDIEQLFLDSVYRSRGRCNPCHFDNWDKNTLGSPPWIHTGGTCNQASLATLRAVERAGYINIDHPDQSLLLLKPLAVSDGGVEHGGDDKFHGGPNDTAYLNFRRFLEHYSACKRGVSDAGSSAYAPSYTPPG